ncbi:A-kinase anchor protein 9 isoform X3 [Meriones unguiculatus]|uniref:A-kinase anchor protein 9 isoform X3 n=1 Tax=Meriones unguiculatus TaxID=10047 RepID=UPI00293F60D6|nr:A-kinase anchor protein 9 isoform X3 [Meriones unguiculatus]
MEDEERRRKVEAGRAKLARYRQKKALREGQSTKKPKKKKTSSCKQDLHSANLEQQKGEASEISSQCVQPAGNPGSSGTRSLPAEEKVQSFSAEPESELSTTPDDYTSEEEEFALDDYYSEQGAQSHQTQLEFMESELARKQQEIEELTQELERKATFGTEGMQQLQEFEAAIIQRDGIITQLTSHLQQARREKDDIMKEFFQMTEQSQKLQVQLQHLQEFEAAIIQRDGIITQLSSHLQQARREKDDIMKEFSELTEQSQKLQVQLQHEKDRKVENLNKKEIQENQAIIEALNTRIIEEEKKTVELKNKVTTADKLLEDLQEQVTEKDQEIKSLKLELASSQQNERKCSEEIKQLMGTVEELQKRTLKDSQLETSTVQRMEQEAQWQLEKLQAELDEMYGKQIVQMKQELIRQHMSQIEELKSQHKEEMENTVSEDQLKLMNELNIQLQDTQSQKEKLKEELGVVLGENSALQSQFKDLLEELSFFRDQVQKARQTIAEQENKMSEARKSLSTVEDLKAQLVAATESRKELEVKHEAEVTNYKIKLEMLEKEKNAVLDRMAESQEAELERLRTQLLFSHEEELSKLKEDLEVEHQINIEKLKDNLAIHYRQQIDSLQSEMSRKMETMQCETDSLVTQQNQLISEISKLRDMQEHRINSQSEEMTLQINELQKEIETLRQEKLIAIDSSTCESECRCQKEIEVLTKEKEDLKLQCLHLNEEIEKQRNTFSFAEKNFEVNYEELQKEYICLLKVRDNLEDSQTKQALEYESKIKALKEELHLQRGRPVMQQGERSGSAGDRAYLSEPLEVGEVVEKDTTELMEKLEVTKREKLELSEKLSGVSEQLKQTHGKVDSLSAEVRSLQLEKEQLLLRCRELETLSNPDATENAALCPAQLSSCKPGLVTGTGRHCAESVSETSGELAEDSKLMIEDKVPFKESRGERLLLPARTTELPHVAADPCENEKLQQELHALKAEQDELRLQMEAQRICLSLVYTTYAEEICEYMAKERDGALCSLQELVSAQEKTIEELHKTHQCQLQSIRAQETGDGEPLQVLTEQLQKVVTEECSYISKSLNSVLDDYYTPLKCEMNIEEKENSGVYTSQNQRPELHEYRHKVQDFQKSLQILLGRVMEECNKLSALQKQLSKISEQDPVGMTRKIAEDGVREEEAALSPAPCLANSENTCTDFHCENRLPASEEKQEQFHGLECRRASLQQQVKEAEADYGAGIQCLQERIQPVSEAAAQTSVSVDSVVFKDSDAETTEYHGNCQKEHIGDKTKVKQETNRVMLMEKQYQERLEEEKPKDMSMNEAFVQQTELSRLSEQKENSIQSEKGHGLYWQEHHFNDIKSQRQGGVQTFEAIDKSFKEEFKSLSKELEEHRNEVPLSNHDACHDVLKSGEHGLTISEEIFSKDETFMRRKSSHDEVLVSSVDTSRQLRLHEEQLEDMRQELVRQYEEHQQATELLRQAHMQQMERQREDQEQLQEEIERLHKKLAQRPSVDPENLVTERERELLEELEALKQLSVAGRQELCSELRNSSTQTQDGNDSQEAEEQTLKEETLERSPEDVPLDISLSNERYALKKANNRLLKILLEVVKTTAAAEETIDRHVLGILDKSSKGQSASSLLWSSEIEASTKPSVQEQLVRVTDGPIPSYPGSADMWLQVTEEGTELSQQLANSGFAGPVIDPENEELMLSISSRLQAAVEKLLEAISESTSQLEHAKVTQTELMRESFRQKQEAAEALQCQEQLRERLDKESRAREQLASELSKADVLIDGYLDEKIVFERQIQEKTDIIHRLEQELLCMSSRLHELESEHQRMQEERELLSMQMEVLRAEAGPVEQQFLQETEKLMNEKLEVQCQAEKMRCDLQKLVKALETDVEEQVNRFVELEKEKNAELTDLKQQNRAQEKQLEKMRKFLGEQAIDREHERDVFQQEIQKLEEQLKTVPRFQPVSEHQTREVEQLTNHLKEKTDKCSELLLSKEQLQRDIQERNEEIEKLEGRVRELEQALIISAVPSSKVEDQKQFGDTEAKPELSLEVQLQAERDAIDRKEKEITNLEEQLEQFREELENKNEEVQELHMQLEIQRKESTTRLQELQQENRLFKDEMEKLGFSLKDSDPVSTLGQPVLFGKFTKIIQEKDIEIDQLNEQLIKLQQQLKLTTDNKIIEEKNELIRDLESQIECLMSDQESMNKNREEEIEHLNGVIAKLQQELASFEQKTADADTILEDADSFKHQLEKVTVEKLALQQQVETTNEEMAYMQNILKEINFKMDQVTETLCHQKKECTNKKQLPSVDMAVSELSRDKLQPGVPSKDAGKPLENQPSLTSIEEGTKASRSPETKSLLLESSVRIEDSEPNRCQEQVETMQELGQSEIEILQRKITNLEQILQEKVAVALVSQAQLEVIQEFMESYQEMQTEPERKDVQNVNCLTETNTRSDVSTLAMRIAELESQAPEVQSSIISKKEQVDLAEKNASETEKKVLAQQKLLNAEERQEEKGKRSSAYLETTDKLIHASGDRRVLGALEAPGAESVATKELTTYKERAEKLEEELLVKERTIISLKKDLSHVKDQLTEAKEELSHFLVKENRTGEQESRKVPMPESLPVEVGGHSGPQTGEASKAGSSNQTLQILVGNASIQIGLQNKLSPEVTETLNQFTEKIEQLQELHAAEILDIESRHILETETLKREHFVALQLLTEECDTLKEMTQCLKSRERSSNPELTYSDTCQTREVCSSDSESEWGQSQGFDTASEGREEGESSSDLFPKKLQGLIRAVQKEGAQVLSLSESSYDGGEDSLGQHISRSWLEERKAFLSTISSLKDLISKMQVQRETEVCDSSQSPDHFSDWRGELLLALQRVFLKEHSVLLAAFQTELTFSTGDAGGLLQCLEQRIQEQSREYKKVMECLQKADRRSLLAEIKALRAQLNGRKMALKRELDADKASQGLLVCSMQQTPSPMLEIQGELSSLKDRAAELQDQLSSEKMVVLELKSELAQTKLELGTTLKAQHKRLKELEAFRLEIKDKTDEVNFLSDTLASEQKKSLELQWALEKEMAKSGHQEEQYKEELEDLKFSLEDQKRRNAQLNLLLEHQKQLLNESQQKIESQKVLFDAQLSEERGRNLELQVLVESEQVRVQELQSTLDKERVLHAQLQSHSDGGQPPPALPSEDLLKELQRQLEEKHSRIVELLTETEKYKLDSLQTRQQMEKDRQVHRKTLQTEQEANSQGQKKMHELQSKVEELQRQLQEKRQQVYKLDLEGKRLQGIMQEFQKQELEREEKLGSRPLVYQNLNEPPIWNYTDDRTRNWVLQQKMGETKDTNYSQMIEMNGRETGHHDLEIITQTLQHVASKLQHVAQKAGNRLQFEAAGDVAFFWIQENIDGIIFQLQKLTGQPGDEHNLAHPSYSCGSLTESLMRQNAELTGYITHLTEEKNSLRSMVMKLKEQLRCYWRAGAGRGHSSRFSFATHANIEAIVTSEKEIWNREKLALQKSLERAEAKVCKLKAELRNDALLQNLSTDAEHATLQRIYSKYLRASSFRKALIYQKKYLLLLLGGFQQCEDATLGVLAQMGGHPAFTEPKATTIHSKGFTRFRSAVRVSIAISRMKYLVRRWQHLTCSNSININRDGFGLNPGVEKNEPFYHSAGGLELCAEPRHTAYRSRPELDSPRSPLPGQNRYPGTPADLNSASLACSQLQQYDPDKALTDYIARLEALKRRLGTIQSGPSTQFHIGMRR